MKNVTSEELIRIYDLRPHPEGGFFRETYRSDHTIPGDALPSAYRSDRRLWTCIYFLLPRGSRSLMHRLRSDEVWHFYRGGPLTVVQIRLDGQVEVSVMGPDVLSGQQVQHLIPAGLWMGAFPSEGTEYAFVGCTVAPGFEFDDLEWGRREDLVRQYPHARHWIERLTARDVG